MHPMAIAAYLGFLLTAINFLPFKRFDGGKIVHSMYGARGNALIAQVVKFLILVLGLLQFRSSGQNGALLFAIILTFFPTLSDPALNDVTEINSGRDVIGLVILAIGVAIFLPVGGSLARILGV
jgi:membrane-associated protease RseP (regulator of RpoE activity)